MKNVLDRYCHFVERHSSPRATSMAAILLVLAVVGMAGVVNPFVTLMNGTLPLDITLFYGMVQARTYFNEIPEAAAHYYLSTVMVADTVFPLAYGVLLSVIVARLLFMVNRGESGVSRWLIAYPLIPTALDYAENAGFVIALQQGREVSEVLLLITMWASSLKWIFAFAGFAILAWLIVSAMVVVQKDRT